MYRSAQSIRVRFSRGFLTLMVTVLCVGSWQFVVLARSPDEMHGVPVLELLPESVIRAIALLGVPVSFWMILRALALIARGAWAVREEGSQMFVRVAALNSVEAFAAQDLVDVRLGDRFLRLWFRDGSQVSLRRSMLRKEDLSSLFESDP